MKGDFAGAKGYRYALIGAYVMPKLSGYKDAPVQEPDPEEEAVAEEDEWMDEVEHREEPLDPKDEEELKRSKERYDELMKGIGDTMEYQVLHYAVPLRTRLMKEVDVAVKALYLQLRAEGLPVTRIHSDRARASTNSTRSCPDSTLSKMCALRTFRCLVRQDPGPPSNILVAAALSTLGRRSTRLPQNSSSKHARPSVNTAVWVASNSSASMVDKVTIP